MKAPIFCHGTHKELHQIRMHLQQNQQLKENLQGSYQRAEFKSILGGICLFHFIEVDASLISFTLYPHRIFDWTCIQISIENVFYALEMHSFIMGFQQWASKK
jgi:hypothetical protein